jgi:hypothetical protein
MHLRQAGDGALHAERQPPCALCSVCGGGAPVMMKIVNGEPRYFSEPPFDWVDMHAEIDRTMERAAAARQLRDEEAAALRLIHSSSTRVEGYRRYFDVLVRRHNIKVEWRTAMPDGVAAYAISRRRTIVVPPIVSDQDFAVCLHEAGHCIAGKCSNKEPHRRNPAVTDWWHCVACETEAWEIAMRIAPFTEAMHEHLRRCLATYRRITPASAAAVTTLDHVASFTGYAKAKQARLRREMMEQRQRLVWASLAARGGS